MKRDKRKLKAFTLLELIVVMLVGAILFASLWNGYAFIQKYLISGVKKSEAIEGFMLVQQQLTRDFEKSEKVTWDNSKLTMVLPREEVRYQFYDDYLVRYQSNRSDTIVAQCANIQAVFLSGNSENIRDVANFSFEVVVQGRKLKIYEVKQYGAVDKFRLETGQ